MNNPARILIAEDHTIVRAGVRSLLQTHADEFAVIGEAENGKDAIQQTASLQPDLVLLDLKMPYANGTEVLAYIKRRSPQIKVVVLTQYNNGSYVRAAFAAGADGYLLKYDGREALYTALRSVLNGGVYVSPQIGEAVIKGYLSADNPAANDTAWAMLTMREREILKRIAEGATNAEIAAELSLSVRTVESHRASLKKKLKLRNTSELIAYAIDNGLV